MPRTRRHYTPTDIDTALLVLALTGHNSVETARRLKSQGLDINPRTLRAWRTVTHAKRYAEIQARHAPEIEREMIGTAREIVLAANAATQEAIEATRAQLAEGDAKDPSAVARNLQTVAGIATDKALLTEGRPTLITSSDDIQAVMARVARQLGFPAVVDSTAEDDIPPELEPSAPMFRSDIEARP